MTMNGWLQIALFAVLVVLIAKPSGGWMIRVFAGERKCGDTAGRSRSPTPRA
jgi:K+-transporting ATPase A subunit